MKSKFILIALLIATALLISACTVNLKTIINPDGSGEYITEVGFTDEDMNSLASMGYSSLEAYCSSLLEDMPPATEMTIDTRRDDTYCVLSLSFTNLSELSAYYEEESGVSVIQLEMVDQVLHYSVIVDSSGGDITAGQETNWILELPGTIQSHSADTVDGNTLTWVLAEGTSTHIQATSKVGGFNRPGGTTTYLVIAGGCLCSLLIAVICTVAIVLILRRRKQSRVQ
jgi:hypothetical protein